MALRFVKVLADPIHGAIDITSVENSIISTPLFQRLRYVRQLGLSDMVYHGTSHSRFSHSIGVAYVASELIDGLRINAIKYANLAQANYEEFDILKDQTEQLIRIAALLHDIGHFPLSHVLENTVIEICRRNKQQWNGRHETLGKKIILETVLGDILDRNDIDPKEVVSLITSDNVETLARGQMISSNLDADRLDYLLRDSYFAGVSYGNYDLSRIKRILIPIKDPTGEFREFIVFHQKGIPAIEQYLLGRYNMYQQVYMHKSTVFFEEVISRLYEIITDEEIGILPVPWHYWENPEDLVSFDDNTLFHTIHSIYRRRHDKDLGEKKKEATHYATLLTERRTYKLVWDQSELKGRKQRDILTPLVIWQLISEKLQKEIEDGNIPPWAIIMPRPENESLRAVTPPPLENPPENPRRFFQWAYDQDFDIKKQITIIDREGTLRLLTRDESPGIVIPLIADMSQTFYRVFADRKYADFVEQLIQRAKKSQTTLDPFT